MNAAAKQQPGVSLDDSQLWQLSKVVAIKARKAVKSVPYDEHYIFSNPVVQSASQLTSDIAMAVGRGRDNSFDYRMARGRLFAVKGLLLAAQELGFLEVPKDLTTDIETLSKLLDAAIEKSEPPKVAVI